MWCFCWRAKGNNFSVPMSSWGWALNRVILQALNLGVGIIWYHGNPQPSCFRVYSPDFLGLTTFLFLWFWGEQVYTNLATYVWVHHRSSITKHCFTAQNQSNSISEGLLNGVDMVNRSWLVKFCFHFLPSLRKMKPKPCFGTYTFLVQLWGGSTHQLVAGHETLRQIAWMSWVSNLFFQG